MANDLSILNLVLEASLLVQAVMALLLIVSLISWTMIFQKRRMVRRARAAAVEFESRFWSGNDLTVLYRDVTNQRDMSHHGNNAGMAKIFESGFKEFVRLRKQGGIDPMAVVEGAQRAMRVELSREIERLETQLSFLATVGSTSPYIGLLGTVWGIMNAFIALSNEKQTTLASVAPGIAEALIATAMGLFAAIPAVVAYNHYANDVERIIVRYDNFIEEFSTILQRQAHTPNSSM